MADEKKVTTIHSKELGCDVVLNPNGEYAMSNDSLYAFYEAHGVPEAKKVFKAINTARGELIEAGASFLKDKVIKDQERKTLVCGMAENRFEIQLNNRTTNMNPQTREEIESFGSVKVKFQTKVPSALLKDDGVLASIAKEIAAGFKK